MAAGEALIACLVAELSEAEAAAAADAERVKEAEAKVTATAFAHNWEQPIVLLPDALQRKIIDLFPIGR